MRAHCTGLWNVIAQHIVYFTLFPETMALLFTTSKENILKVICIPLSQIFWLWVHVNNIFSCENAPHWWWYEKSTNMSDNKFPAEFNLYISISIIDKNCLATLTRTNCVICAFHSPVRVYIFVDYISVRFCPRLFSLRCCFCCCYGCNYNQNVKFLGKWNSYTIHLQSPLGKVGPRMSRPFRSVNHQLYLPKSK